MRRMLKKSKPSEKSLHPWDLPSSPWQRIHIDFAGPFLDQNFLIIVDTHSEWPEFFPVKQTTKSITIEILRTIFARNGIPEQIVSDGDPNLHHGNLRNFQN